ncbi:MAG TPA: IS21 family transposase [Candidatus Binatia bacterium]|nr:IS21 family transposase [Candidatus Binatia bacterium]
MANRLKMANIHAIIGLLEQEWSHRRIARELGVDRETVARYDRLRRNRPTPAISTTGSELSTSPNAAIPTAGSLLEDLVFVESSGRQPGRTSHCDPFKDLINQKLDEGLSAQRIWQDLVSDNGFTGSYSSVKRYVQRLGASTPLPFRRMECEPGQEAQVDFGSGAWVFEDGKRRRPHILRITLSHSRKSYSEPIWRQTTENFIRSLENAFRAFGGVPKTLVIDNLKAAVTNADWFDPDLNPKVVEFARHYGTVILPTKPYTPRHKGKIEGGVKYVKNNALKGRIFSSLHEQKQFLLKWESDVADTRIHGTTKKQVRRVFEEVERHALQSLPLEPFPFYHEGRRKVHRDGHVEVAKSYYSVPPEYLGREVWVRWDSRLVRVFNGQFEQIAVHPRVAPGKFNTSRAHLADQKISAVERGAEYMLRKAVSIGVEASLWAKAMLDNRGIEGVRVLQGFIHLARKYPAAAINRASKIAHQAGMFRLRSLRELIKRTAEQEEFEFTDSHPIIRPLSEYQNLITISFKPTEERKESS